MKKSLYLFFFFFLPVLIHSQTFIWADAFSGTNSKLPTAIATDSAGNVFTTGRFYGTTDFDPGAGAFNLSSAGLGDIYIQKTSATGNFMWAKSIGGANDDAGMGIAVDSSGNALITGYFYLTADFDPGPGVNNITSLGSNDGFVLKLDASGNFVWVVRIGTTNDEAGYGIAVDDTGNVYTIGPSFGTADFDPGPGVVNLPPGQTFFVQKLTPTGNFSFVKGWTNLSDETDVFVDSNHNILITGYYTAIVDFDPGPGLYNLTATGAYDIYCMKLNATGDFLWAKGFGSSAQDYGRSITTDAAGNVYATGEFTGTADFDPSPGGTFNLSSAGGSDFFIQKLDPSGNFDWAKSFGGTAYDYGTGIDVNSHGHVLSTGYYTNVVDFNPGTGTYNLGANTQTNGFIECLDSNGSFLWAFSTSGNNSYAQSYAVAVDDSDHIYSTGIFYNITDFDAGAGTFNLSPALVNNPDLYVLKLGECFADFSGLGSAYCTNNPAVTLTGIPSGGVFSGTGVSGNQFNPSTAGPGTFTITYSMSGGCVAISSRSVTITATPNSVFSGLHPAYCIPDSMNTLVPVTGGGVFSGTGVSMVNMFSPNLAGVGTHAVVYTVTSGGCTGSSSVTTTVNNTPNSGFSGMLPSYCINSQVSVLTPVISGGTFSGNGVSGNIFSPSSAGVGTHTVTYTVTVSGCVSSTAVITFVHSLPLVTLGPDSSICMGDSILLDAGNPGLTYFWTGGGMLQTLSVNTTGIYSVNVTDAFGCQANDSIMINTIPMPVAIFAMNQSATPSIAFTDNSTGNPTNWSWNFGDTATSNQQNPSHTYSASGTYTVRFIASNSCGSDTVTDTVSILILGTDPGTAQSLVISPNPNEGDFSLQVKGFTSGEAAIEIFGVDGKKIWIETVNHIDDSFKKEIKLKGIGSGLYLLKIIVNGNQILSRRFLVE